MKIMAGLGMVGQGMAGCGAAWQGKARIKRMFEARNIASCRLGQKTISCFPSIISFQEVF